MRQSRLRPFVSEGVRVGSVELSQPVMTASGTAGHADELAPYMRVDQLGAMVVKSLYHSPWPGNPAPRVHPVAAGMINAVGLQGPGVDQWIHSDLPLLEARGARVVASIWGRGVDDYQLAASMLAPIVPEKPTSVPAIPSRSTKDTAFSSTLILRVAMARWIK